TQDETPIVLSPFEVSADEDVGYEARETLAGGRTRTSLDDIANTIDVITGQLIEDMGALDLQDIAAYANNIEAGSLMGDNNEDGSLTSLWDQNTTYFRGFRTYRGTRNFMFTLMSFNSFSSDRIDLSKGPNAVLFGVGEPGGAINYNTKRPGLSRSRNSVSFRTDSEGSLRGQLDVDQTLIKNKLGFRAALLSERTDFAWKPAYSNTDGAFIAGAYKPFSKTTVRANFEYRNVNRALGRRIYPRDMFTPYFDAGSPKVIAPLTSNNARIEGNAATVPVASIGLARNSAVRMTVLEDGTMINTQNTATSIARSVGAVDNVQVMRGVYPEATVIEGRNGISDSQDKMLEVTLEQELAKNLYLELGFADWTMERLQGNGVLNNTGNLQVDPNGFMPGSTTAANPNFGRYYSEAQPWLYDRHESVKTYRATLSYARDFTRRSRWFGSHRASIMWENYKFKELWDRRHLMITGTPTGVLPNANPSNNANRVWTRDYYDFATGDSYMQDITAWYYQDQVDLGSGYTGGWLRTTTGLRANLTDTTTKLAVWQGSWFDNRVILTWGYRGLNQKNYNANQQGYIVRDSATQEFVWRDPATGETRTNIFDASMPPEPRSIDSGAARNEGLVFKVLPWLSLTANHATNFNPTAGLSDITGEVRGAAKGETKDFGIRLRLWDGRVNFSALHYQTDATGLMTGGPGRNSPYANIDSMYDILVANGVLDENPFDTTVASNQVVFNQKAKGYEFTLFARPVEGLSLRFGAASTENIASDVGNEVVEYYQNVARPMLSNPAYAQMTNGSNTIASLLTSADNNLQQMQNYSGRRNPPSSRLTANLNVSYSFDRGTLFNGFTVGGGVRWRGEPLMGYWTNADGSLDLSRPFYAPDNFNIDVFARYRRKLSNKITWSVQFNIRNVANDPGFDGVRAINETNDPSSPIVVTRYSLKDPRLFILSNTFSF
ncbi:MAG: TonB-dependent receptor plug domain-containing protein, partial [Opitutaceae bacterium]|nr:TonB-dependent receptor plug domain-containing protein [Opitutaceae bacterium]